MKERAHTQSGNAVLMVLIGVALFAALAYTFMRGSQQGQGNLTAQQVKIQSTEIIGYAQSVEKAISRLRNKGCSESQLSFDYDIAGTTGYENPSSPPDYSCHVFHSAGGKITYTASPISGSPWFFITSRVLEAGPDKTYCSETPSTPCDDLLIMLSGLSLQTCQAINQTINGNTNVNLQDNGTAYDNSKFSGSLSDGPTDIEMGSNANKETGCIQGTDTKYYFFHVLLAR